MFITVDCDVHINIHTNESDSKASLSFVHVHGLLPMGRQQVTIYTCDLLTARVRQLVCMCMANVSNTLLYRSVYTGRMWLFFYLVYTLLRVRYNETSCK